MVETLTNYCDLCSGLIKDKEEAREIVVRGRVFTLCCNSCESALLAKDVAGAASPFMTTHEVSDAGLLFAWLKQAVNTGASDLFISVAESPILKIYGSFYKLSYEILDHQTVEDFIRSLLPAGKTKDFFDGSDVDLGFEVRGVGRFRANIFRHYRGLSMAIRPLPAVIKSFGQLGLPEVFSGLVKLTHGLILITGPAGSGKTTTLASFVNTVNLQDERHIITIEDPIEYLISNQRSLVHQREVGWHTGSFSDGLRSALRESPDVIVVGELRDLESISLALRAAETGHLVLGTLHSGGAVQAITRVVDAFDSLRQEQVMVQLAQSLRCVCSQRLIPRRDRRGMALVTEILMGTLAISNLIRQDRVHEIRGYMETGQSERMHTFKQSIAQLVRAGVLDRDQKERVEPWQH